MTSELRPADSPWECFRDEAYYDMWCLRRENWRTFGQGFHLMRGEEAEALRDLLNEQAAELAKFKALAVAAAAYIADLEDHEGAEGFSQSTAELRRKYEEARDET